MDTSTRLPGHGLLSEGWPYEWRQGDEEDAPSWHKSARADRSGHGVCSCRAASPGPLETTRARRDWHKAHKDEIRTGAVAATVPDFADAQRRAWANKLAKGFNVTDVPMEFGLLVEEIGEAFSAWRKARPDLGGELADVAIFLLGLAGMVDVDLGTEVEVKLAANEARAYVRLPNGTPVKAGTEPS